MDSVLSATTFWCAHDSCDVNFVPRIFRPHACGFLRNVLDVNCSQCRNLVFLCDEILTLYHMILENRGGGRLEIIRRLYSTLQNAADLLLHSCE